VANISTVRPGGASNLRSEAAETNLLRVKAENDEAASYLLIGYKEDATDGFQSGVDVQKLFSPLDYVPEIYALADTVPADIFFINNKKETVVPLGIKTGRAGEISLTFTGMDNYLKASRIELVDAKENRTINLTGKSTYTYTFNLSETGISTGRFSLRFGNSPATGLPTGNDSDALKVYGDSKGIYVVTPAFDPVRQVAVYDLQGQKVYESYWNTGYYALPEGLEHSPMLIVKVTTKNLVKTVKIERNY